MVHTDVSKGILYAVNARTKMKLGGKARIEERGYREECGCEVTGIQIFLLAFIKAVRIYTLTGEVLSKWDKSSKF